MNFNFLTEVINKVQVFFTKGHNRSINAKKNIIGSTLMKGSTIAISLIMLPLTLKFLDQTQYGIWLTMTSVIGWCSFFDIGVGNGLRVKYAEAIAKNNYELAKTLTSTAYAIVTLIVIALAILFFLVSFFIDWTVVFNADKSLKKIITLSVFIVFFGFCFQFVLRLINTILSADQKVAFSDLITFISSVLSLSVIYISLKFVNGSLPYFAMILSILPVIVLTLFTIIFFTGRYKSTRPSFKYVDFSYSKVLLSLGVKFFTIQISSLVLFSTTNIIISHLFSPAEVVPYNIANRYFSVVVMIFSLVSSPLVSAYTDAFNKNDLDWVKNVMKKSNRLGFSFIFFTLFMIIISPIVYKLWIGDKVIIPWAITLLIGIYTAYNTWATTYSTFINGIGKLKIAYYFGIVNSVLYIPLAIFLGKALGIKGLILAMILLTLPGLYWLPVQCKKLINHNAKGIWNE